MVPAPPRRKEPPPGSNASAGLSLPGNCR